MGQLVASEDETDDFMQLPVWLQSCLVPVITLAALWIVWCALHSLLISQPVQHAAKKILGNRFQLYRLLYVCFSIVSLVPVLWYQLMLPQHIFINSNWLWRVGQSVLLVYAGVLFYCGARVYDMGYFIGLSQLQAFKDGKKPDSFSFHSDGILSYVRHPWYSAGIAFVWGIGSCTDVYLLTRTILTVYFILGSLLEERRLRRELGEQYTKYCSKVPMLIPWKKGPGGHVME